MDDLKILENSRLFAGIRVDEIQPMLSCLQAVERKYPRGAYIFHTGEEVRALALLVRGTAHIQKEDFWGNRSLLASLAAGDIFAEAYAMPGSGAMRSDRRRLSPGASSVTSKAASWRSGAGWAGCSRCT